MTGKSSEWWSLQPLWLKLTFILVALPAWIYIMAGDLGGRKDGIGDVIAFGLFIVVTLTFIVVDWRRKRGMDRG